MDKKGQTTGPIMTGIIIVIMLVALGFISTAFAKAQATLRDTMTAGTVEFDIANKSLEGQKQIGDNMSTLYIIGVIVMIIGMIFTGVLGYFMRVRA